MTSIFNYGDNGSLHNSSDDTHPHSIIAKYLWKHLLLIVRRVAVSGTKLSRWNSKLQKTDLVLHCYTI